MPDGNRVQFPIQTRLAPIENVDAEARTVDVVFSTGAAVKRYDWERGRYYMETLSLEPGAVRLGRLNSGAPVLDAHNRWSLRDVMGVVEPGTAKVDGKRGTATLRFSKREEVEPIFRDIKDKIIVNVSSGYISHRIQMTDEMIDGLPVYRTIDWEPMEISPVPIGADAGAGVRSEQQRTFPCEILEVPAVSAAQRKESAMTEQERAAAEAAEAKRRKEEEDAERARQAEANQAAVRAERARINLIDELVARHGLPTEFRTALVNDEKATPEIVRERVLEELAKKSEKTPVRSATGHIEVVGDERLQRRGFIAEAIAHRIMPAEELSDGARQYRYMPMLRLAEEVLTIEGVSVRGLSRLDLATRAMQSTSDFPNILADVANKRLRDAYEENVPTYSRWARRAANASDFKPINVVQLSAAPALLKVVEGGEFTYGKVTDGKETYSIVTYGRIIPITRQAIINDDLNAFDRLPRAFSGSARRLENYTVYQQLLSNPAMADSIALFHADHGNLPTAAAISATSLGLARAAMRKQTGLAGEKLNLAPKFLLAGPDKEQEAYQYTSSQFVPAKSSDVNEFRQGGRTALEPIVDNEISGNKWFLAADNMQVDTVEYAYLDGSEGVFLESQVGFKIDGIELKARLDFAAKAVDYRGLVYNSGA